MYIHDDCNSQKKKIQYYTSVKYKDIQNINIIFSNRKSNGERTTIDSITGGSEKLPYLEITTKDGEKKLFLILCFTNSRIKKIVIELKHRAYEVGNFIEIDDIDSIMKKMKACK